MAKWYIFPALLTVVLSAGTVTAQTDNAATVWTHVGGSAWSDSYALQGYPFYTGCCNGRDSCCDNLWAGYCSHRDCHHLGCGKSSSCGCGSKGSVQGSKGCQQKGVHQKSKGASQKRHHAKSASQKGNAVQRSHGKGSKGSSKGLSLFEGLHSHDLGCGRLLHSRDCTCHLVTKSKGGKSSHGRLQNTPLEAPSMDGPFIESDDVPAAPAVPAIETTARWLP